MSNFSAQVKANGQHHPSTGILHSEADHRIANNLALIVGLLRLRGRAVLQMPGPMKRDDVRLLLDDVAARVETIARLHRMLSRPSRRTMVNVGDYLQEICRSLTASLLAEERVQLSRRSDESCELSPDQVLPLGLLISELVTNSVKYAHPSGVPIRMELSCRRDAEGRLIVDFSDDGVGLPEHLDPLVDGGLGFRLVRSFGEQLGATISFDSDSLGMHFRLEMPARLYAVAEE